MEGKARTAEGRPEERAKEHAVHNYRSDYMPSGIRAKKSIQSGKMKKKGRRQQKKPKKNERK